MSPESKRPDQSVLVDVLKGQLRPMIVCLSQSWGGLEQVAAQDSLDLLEAGISPRVMALSGSPLAERISSHPGIELSIVDDPPRNTLDFALRRALLKDVDDGINVIHAHQPSLLGSITPWFFRRPEVAIFASRHIWCNHDKRDLVHQAIYRRLDAMIVMSHALRRNVLNTHPLKERQVKLINLGLDFAKFDPAQTHPVEKRKSWGIDPDATVVGIVGRIDPAKGQETFIKAAAGLSAKVGEHSNLHFVIVGEETRGSVQDYLPTLKEIVKQFRIESQVHFVGFDSNIPEVMSAFDMLVMPSREETFGLVAIEAMVMERPVIVSKGGSADEIVGAQSEFGLQMRPDDAFDLQRQILKLLESPAHRRDMGVLAREHVLRNYDRRERLRKTLSLYERALRRRGIV